ncbi:MAG TPA: hypothetical protein VKK30_03055, partial [Actinomycetota bacterium]|nr:hypothetical protein [Actinomycetota bacterium]
MVRNADPLEFFTAEQIERARRYHGALYRALVADLVIGVGALATLSFSPVGDWLYRQIIGQAWWERALAFTGITLATILVLRVPLSFWRGYVHEKRWGFSTQSVRGWLIDRLKGFAVGLVLTSGTLLGLVALVRTLPKAWPAVVAPAGGLLI